MRCRDCLVSFLRDDNALVVQLLPTSELFLLMMRVYRGRVRAPSIKPRNDVRHAAATR
jgi:hypothetical protein